MKEGQGTDGCYTFIPTSVDFSPDVAIALEFTALVTCSADFC